MIDPTDRAEAEPCAVPSARIRRGSFFSLISRKIHGGIVQTR